MGLVRLLMGRLRVLLCHVRMFLALRMVALAMMFGRRTVRLGRIFVMFSRLVVFVSCHVRLVGRFAPSTNQSTDPKFVPVGSSGSELPNGWAGKSKARGIQLFDTASFKEAGIGGAEGRH